MSFYCVSIDSYVYPAGSNVVIPIISLHNDFRVWPEPEKFDPDRFLPEEVEKRHRCSYIPFSYGARNCIGLYLFLRSLVFKIDCRLEVRHDVNESLSDHAHSKVSR